MNAAERVLPAANLREKSFSVYLLKRYGLCLLSLIYQNTSAYFARSKSPLQVLHTIQLLAALKPARQCKPRYWSSQQVPVLPSGHLHLHSIPSTYGMRNHRWTSAFHHCSLSGQPSGPSTPQWAWWMRPIGSSQLQIHLLIAELTSFF